MLGAELARRRTGGDGIVVPYLLADAGRIDRTARIVGAARDAGAAALEVGFPFSDPIADGPVLEEAGQRALARGTRWTHLARTVATAARILPVAVMTYANPVLAHGLAPGLERLARAGATGVIVPDLPLEEAPPWSAAARRAGLALVLLAAPGDDRDRAARLARRTRGFLYLVGRYGTTGGALRPTPELATIVRAAHAAQPRLPVLLGFGVRRPADARFARATGADGVIVGSAFEAAIGPRGDADAGRRLLAPLVTAAARARGPPVL